MAQHADAVRQVVGPVVEAEGLYLEDVTTTRAGSRSVVRITLDLPEDELGSLDSDRLGSASRAVSAALEDDDVVPGAYVLEISTPGTSRPLTELRHFKRARTRLVTLELAEGGTVTGRLVAVEDTDLVLDDGARIPVEAVARGQVEVEMKRLEEIEGDDDLDDDDLDEDGDDLDDLDDLGAAAADADGAGVRESADDEDDATQALDAGRNKEG
ncbi:ribosome maturation factor RimP [Antribacter gilvus]|uniref:ribosome maturation factor RimP n=1 Tax=Antribacter gilvus TaxID=2304675 RepID=UPI000F772BBB|nr:ribosome maturation factor RimP [Antribacter gilvus]